MVKAFLMKKENGIKEEYQLADEGVIQAQLAGELFLKYPEIWALDDKEPPMQPEGGESVNDVATATGRWRKC